MGKKLHVGNLSFSITDATLEEMFSACGKVTSAITVTDRETKKSKGFGFVEMRSDEEAQTAIRELHGKSVDGRNLKVSEANTQEPRADSHRDRGGSRDAQQH